MDDSPSLSGRSLPLSLPSSPSSLPLTTLAPVGVVFPHDDAAPSLLADQASYLTLSAPSAVSAAPGGDGPHSSIASPIASGSRRRACSACSFYAHAPAPAPAQHPASEAGDAHGSSGPAAGRPPTALRPQARTRASASSVASEPSSLLVVSANDARRSSPPSLSSSPLLLPTSHEHIRGLSNMRLDSAAAGLACQRAQTADGHAAIDAGSLTGLPNEVILHVLGYLDVCDLLATSRTCHHLRALALTPALHRTRLRHARAILPPLLTSPSRPSLSDLMARRIFLTNTTVVSRKLARSLTAIRLSRRLAVRPPPEALVARAVLPPECLPGGAGGSGVVVSPALVARRREVERERVKDGLRRWVGSVWERRWREMAEDRTRWEESRGVGRVWRLRRFWERVSRGEIQAR